MTEKGSNNRITRKLATIAIFSCSLIIAACQRQSSDEIDQPSTVDEIEQTTIEESVEDGANEKLLEDGFYSSPNSESQTTSTLNSDLAETSKQDELGAGLTGIEPNDALTPENKEDLFCLNKVAEPPKETIDIQEACRKISNRLASVTYQSCNTAKLQQTQCTSVSGFPILISEFAPLEDRKPQGRILVIGGTHGDELTSVSISFKWIEKLNKYHSGLFHWHVVPMMNPDGVLNRAASRTNKNGVDLNRNMPSDDWEANALKYWEDKQEKNPRKYPGVHAASEPETQWLIDEINTFKPDAIISVHAPYGVVDFDALALNTAPRSLGKLTLNLLGTYPGSLGNYAGINRDIPVITLELPHAWDMPPDKEITKIWEDIVSWLKKNVGDEQLAQVDN